MRMRVWRLGWYVFEAAGGLKRMFEHANISSSGDGRRCERVGLEYTKTYTLHK